MHERQSLEAKSKPRIGTNGAWSMWTKSCPKSITSPAVTVQPSRVGVCVVVDNTWTSPASLPSKGARRQSTTCGSNMAHKGVEEAVRTKGPQKWQATFGVALVDVPYTARRSVPEPRGACSPPAPRLWARRAIYTMLYLQDFLYLLVNVRRQTHPNSKQTPLGFRPAAETSGAL